jgi:hypothetical protein
VVGRKGAAATDGGGLGGGGGGGNSAVVQQSAASISRRSIMASQHNSIPEEDDEKILDETLLEALTVRTQTAASTRSRRASYTTVLNTTATFHDASVKLELDILALLGASIDTTDDGKVVDPFLENLRSHCATRGHNIELVFSLRDAVFMLSKVIQGQDSFSKGQVRRGRPGADSAPHRRVAAASSGSALTLAHTVAAGSMGRGTRRLPRGRTPAPHSIPLHGFGDGWG